MKNYLKVLFDFIFYFSKDIIKRLINKKVFSHYHSNKIML